MIESPTWFAYYEGVYFGTPGTSKYSHLLPITEFPTWLAYYEGVYFGTPVTSKYIALPYDSGVAFGTPGTSKYSHMLPMTVPNLTCLLWRCIYSHTRNINRLSLQIYSLHVSDFVFHLQFFLIYFCHTVAFIYIHCLTRVNSTPNLTSNKFVPVVLSLIFPFHLLTSLVHPTEFSFYIFSVFILSFSSCCYWITYFSITIFLPYFFLYLH